MSTFRIERDPKGSFRMLLTGRSQQLLLDDALHSSIETCRRAIDAVRANAPYDWNYLRREDGTGAFFILKTTTGARLGTSKLFSSPLQRDKVIEFVKRSVKGARVVTNLPRRAGMRELFTAFSHLFEKGHLSQPRQGARHSMARG